MRHSQCLPKLWGKSLNSSSRLYIDSPPDVHHCHGRAAGKRGTGAVSSSARPRSAHRKGPCHVWFVLQRQSDSWTMCFIHTVFGKPMKSIPAWIMTCFLLLCDFLPSFPTFSHSEVLCKPYGASLISSSKQVFVPTTRLITCKQTIFQLFPKTLLPKPQYDYFCNCYFEAPFLDFKKKTLFKLM